MSKVTGSRDGADKKNEVNNGSGQKIEIEVIDAQDASDPGEALEVDEQERIEFLSEDVELMAAQNAELLDSLRRLKADFDNYRKRMIREQTRILETAEAELVKKLLPVIDNLERALGSAGESGPKGLAEGVAKVLELMLDSLARDGLEVIDPQGEPFRMRGKWILVQLEHIIFNRPSYSLATKIIQRFIKPKVAVYADP